MIPPTDSVAIGHLVRIIDLVVRDGRSRDQRIVRALAVEISTWPSAAPLVPAVCGHAPPDPEPAEGSGVTA